jgi:hypothetical protein
VEEAEGGDWGCHDLGADRAAGGRGDIMWWCGMEHGIVCVVQLFNAHI